MAGSSKDIVEQAYDATPYTSHPFKATAPEHLAAVATLFGLQPPRAENARVLELGCASGGNLIPHAQRHPGGHYVGVDLSKVQIDAGQQRLSALGLQNVSLHHMSIGDISPALGQFDYIVCHGVYSWVPPQVQEHILRVCAENLAADGVAVVSYNTYPGWKFKEVVREAMLFRGKDHDNPSDKLAHARGMFNFMHEMSSKGSVLNQVLEQHSATFSGQFDDYYLLHEYLEPYNLPCYFSEFAARARRHKLSYLADSEQQSMFVGNLGSQVAEPLLRECGNDQVALEQYMDFLRNRQFRHTLLVHAQQQGQIRYQLDPAVLAQLHYACAVDSGTAAIAPDDSEQAMTLGGQQLVIRGQVSKLALQILGERFPATLHLPELVEAVRQRLQQRHDNDSGVIVGLMEALVIRGAVEYRVQALEAAPSLDDKPLALASARADLALAPGAGVTNLWHQRVTLNIVEQLLLPKLDGNHTQEQLIEHILQQEQQHMLEFKHKDGQRVSDPRALRTEATEHVGNALRTLRYNGMSIKSR
ncbi:methyltransferase regulatory domain-containing protein [Collimonas sp.]|jgi:methyltransferase-like protein/cyclopropane fatty-acyl-phospholipid synthase-like methyltransferase|uniref:methyltransferase regulatory domain-containing protein n=1 Tax=Collimonas sp. TaxID=1963772 RepID=UPI002C97BEDB|nr:methyltransferase regulatory domain-containing protein [Collimonas sp.]HWX02868.1 methyltransferase regulatory domain-containing protein [Collimonas sp.]